MVRPDESRYLRSLGRELEAQATRVRDLIGDKHWLSDGSHKEAILRGLLSRHIPSGMHCFRGFVVSGDGFVSTEQDILIVDTAGSAPLFQTADLAICFPESVVAAVSVKTKIARDEIDDAVAGLASVRELCRDIWTGVFCFDDEQSRPGNQTLYDAISDAIKAHQPKLGPLDALPSTIAPDLICTMQSLAFVIDGQDSSLRVRGFDCAGHAVALFLGRLIARIDEIAGRGESRLARILDTLQVNPLDPAAVVI